MATDIDHNQPAKDFAALRDAAADRVVR